MHLLNIGCGAHFHPDWTNLDFVSHAPEVRAWDIRAGLPFSDGSFDACYSSHVLEHLTRSEAEALVMEIYRVLKPGGIARLVVPDLELLSKAYLEILYEVLSDSDCKSDKYEWVTIALFDQMVRKHPGGEMARFLRDGSKSSADFVIERGGLEAEQLILSSRGKLPAPTKRSFWDKVRSRRPEWFIRVARQKFAEGLVYLVAGKEARTAFIEGLFRNSGEIHNWAYDRYSLGRVMKNSGFSDNVICAATESRICDFGKYQLDVVGQTVRKPDSIFMEGSKPVNNMESASTLSKSRSS